MASEREGFYPPVETQPTLVMDSVPPPITPDTSTHTPPETHLTDSQGNEEPEAKRIARLEQQKTASFEHAKQLLDVSIRLKVKDVLTIYYVNTPQDEASVQHFPVEQVEAATAVVEQELARYEYEQQEIYTTTEEDVEALQSLGYTYMMGTHQKEEFDRKVFAHKKVTYHSIDKLYARADIPNITARHEVAGKVIEHIQAVRGTTTDELRALAIYTMYDVREQALHEALVVQQQRKKQLFERDIKSRTAAFDEELADIDHQHRILQVEEALLLAHRQQVVEARDAQVFEDWETQMNSSEEPEVLPKTKVIDLSMTPAR